MAEVFIIHGSYGSPEENWFPWLKAELEKADCWVHIPRFPTPEKQSIETWMKAFGKYERFVNESTVFVGHSAGAAFILSYLEKLKQPVKAAFFVAGFTGKLGIAHFDKANSSLADREFVWEAIKRNCGQFHVYASDNDPYVPLAKGKELAARLGVPLNLVRRAGHFNRQAGYSTFEILLHDIKNDALR
jgi:hypothetical protein